MITLRSVCVNAISWRTIIISKVYIFKSKSFIYISQQDIIDKKYVELDQLDMGYNYFLSKNRIHLNLTCQKQYMYDHNNQMSQVMQHIN